MYFLTRFFFTKSYLDQFLAGRLYASSLSRFMEVFSREEIASYKESGPTVPLVHDKPLTQGQQDVLEGTIVEYDVRTTPQFVEAFGEHLVANPRVISAGYRYANVICFCKFNYRYRVAINAQQFGLPIEWDEPHMSEDFGNWAAIILDQSELVRRVTRAADAAGLVMGCRSIDYHPMRLGDRKVISGSFMHVEAEGPESALIEDACGRYACDYDAFDKWNAHAAEQEWRITLARKAPSVEPLVLDVGDLSDIAVGVPERKLTETVNGLFASNGIKQETNEYHGNVGRSELCEAISSLGDGQKKVMLTLGTAEYE